MTTSYVIRESQNSLLVESVMDIKHMPPQIIHNFTSCAFFVVDSLPKIL